MNNQFESTLVTPYATTECHTVQFWENEKFLVRNVTSFIQEGLLHHEAVVIIATLDHLNSFREELADSGFDVSPYINNGQLHLLDANVTLNAFMSEGKNDKARFFNVIGTLIADLNERFHFVRAYGEMVSILWQEGNKKATIELEHLWNELALKEKFNLLCGYSMNQFNDSNHIHEFSEICRAHSHVHETEEYLKKQTPDEKNLAFALLEQQAKSLQLELSRKEETEVLLRNALKARDEFMSIVSHELKTPLTSLNLQFEIRRIFLAKKDLSWFNEEKLKQMLNHDERQIRRLSRLIDDMLDISRLQTGKLTLEKENFDLCDSIKESVERFEMQLQAAGCECEVHSNGPVKGTWDRYRIEQVFVNLLTNAMKYAPGKPIKISIHSDGEHATLAVADEGVGISKEDQKRIFDQFERAVSLRNISGLGLGLYIAKQIIEEHQGSIRVNSKPGEGSVFTLQLPLTSKEVSIS